MILNPSFSLKYALVLLRLSFTKNFYLSCIKDSELLLLCPWLTFLILSSEWKQQPIHRGWLSWLSWKACSEAEYWKLESLPLHSRWLIVLDITLVVMFNLIHFVSDICILHWIQVLKVVNVSPTMGLLLILLLILPPNYMKEMPLLQETLPLGKGLVILHPSLELS